jgi:outer membrane protein TolC
MKNASNPNMRIFLILFLLIPFSLIEGQYVPEKKISLSDAVSLALLNNTGTNNEDVKKVLVGNVEKTYYQLVYEKNKTSIIQQEAGLMQNLAGVADLRYEAGDIDLLEKNSLISRFSDVNTSLSRMEDDMSISRNNLKILLLVKDDLMPADSVLVMYALRKNERKAPELDSTGQFIHERKRENLEYELNNYFKKLQYFNQVGLEQADQLLEINRVKFENEDIDYTEYTQKADEAFQIRLDYLEMLNKYNQTAIQLEFYAY